MTNVLRPVSGNEQRLWFSHTTAFGVADRFLYCTKSPVMLNLTCTLYTDGFTNSSHLVLGSRSRPSASSRSPSLLLSWLSSSEALMVLLAANEELDCSFHETVKTS